MLAIDMPKSSEIFNSTVFNLDYGELVKCSLVIIVIYGLHLVDVYTNDKIVWDI